MSQTDKTSREELIEIIKLAKAVNISGNTKPGEWQGFTYMTDLKQDVEKIKALIDRQLQQARIDELKKALADKELQLGITIDDQDAFQYYVDDRIKELQANIKHKGELW